MASEPTINIQDISVQSGRNHSNSSQRKRRKRARAWDMQHPLGGQSPRVHYDSSGPLRSALWTTKQYNLQAGECFEIICYLCCLDLCVSCSVFFNLTLIVCENMLHHVSIFCVRLLFIVLSSDLFDNVCFSLFLGISCMTYS